MAIMDLFRPKWKHSDPAVRKLAIEKLANLDILAKVANSDSVVEMLADLDILAKVIKSDSDDAVRKAAIKKLIELIEKLSNLHTLMLIAKSKIDDAVCNSATKRLIELIEKLTDLDILTQMANSDSDNVVRKVATEKLRSEVTKKHSDWKTRKLVYEKLGNTQAALAEVAKHEISIIERENALEKLTDQNILADVAKNNPYSSVGKAAVKKLTDQNIIAEIAKNASGWEIRKTAYEKLGNTQASLIEIAKNDYGSEGIAVLEKLSDQNILADVANNSVDSSVRIAAVKKLTDQNIIAETAKNASDWQIRKIAYEKLGNTQAALSEESIWSNSGIGSSKKEDRIIAAQKFIELAKTNPEIFLLDQWQHIRSKIMKPYAEWHDDKHIDSDFSEIHCHKDKTTSTGIGLEFPPFPAHLKPK